MDEPQDQQLNYHGIVYGDSLGRSRPFRLSSRYEPQGDQERAFQELTGGLAGRRARTRCCWA